MKHVLQFARWTRQAVDRLTSELAYLDNDSGYVESVYETAAAVATEAGQRALKLGLVDLHGDSLPLAGTADPYVVLAYLGRCAEAASAKSPPPKSDVLTVPQAAAELGIGQEAVRAKCNRGELEHRREGTRGRGGKGTILIPRSAIERYQARQTVCRTPLPASIVPQVKARPKVISTHW